MIHHLIRKPRTTFRGDGMKAATALTGLAPYVWKNGRGNRENGAEKHSWGGGRKRLRDALSFMIHHLIRKVHTTFRGDGLFL